MDRASLDAAYNLRKAFPSFGADLARWRQASAQARSAIPHRADIAYGPHPAERLDYFSTGRPDRPILAFIHGGFWQAMDRADFSFVASGFAAAGLANVAVLGYPLAPTVKMDRIVASIRRALLWLWREGGALGGDPQRIYAAGHSAGGHLVALAALTDWPALAPGAPDLLLRGGLCISGIYDLRPIQACFHNDVLGMDLTEADRNSPLLLLPGWRGPLPALALAVGEQETDAFHDQQSAFALACAAKGAPVTAVTEPRRHHFDILHDLGRPDGPIQADLVSMIRAGD